eukprot:jgi/Hompol1/2174/HPOL_001432-RA
MLTKRASQPFNIADSSDTNNNNNSNSNTPEGATGGIHANTSDPLSTIQADLVSKLPVIDDPSLAVDTNDPVVKSNILLMTTLLSNRSASHCSSGAFYEALLDAMAVIKWRPEWVKGHFRKGEALLGLKLLDLALEAYQTAIALDKESGTIKGRILRISARSNDEKRGLAIHQLLPGREICLKSVMQPVQSLIFDYAVQMRNHIHLIGNIHSKECLVVDICWDVDGVIAFAKTQGLTIVGAICTHYHLDHVGGIPPPPFDGYGVRVDGVAKILKKLPNIKAYAHKLDIDQIIKLNPELSASRFQETPDGFTLYLPLAANTNPDQFERISSDSYQTKDGAFLTECKFMHTPGHTPGSQCILVNRDRLFSGDTLFPGSCGRVDSPDSSKTDMYESLQVRLASLPGKVIVYPGHDYGGDITTIEREREVGLLFPADRERFLKQFG